MLFNAHFIKPKPRAFINRISVRFHETDCIWLCLFQGYRAESMYFSVQAKYKTSLQVILLLNKKNYIFLCFGITSIEKNQVSVSGLDSPLPPLPRFELRKNISSSYEKLYGKNIFIFHTYKRTAPLCIRFCNLERFFQLTWSLREDTHKKVFF